MMGSGSLRTGHHGVLGRVGAVGDDQTCRLHVNRRSERDTRGCRHRHRRNCPVSIRRFVYSSTRRRATYQQRRRGPSASLLQLSAISVAVGSVRGGGAASRGPGLHARKGAGNFLKGATPSQDMMGEFVGIARVAIGLMWRGVDVAGTKSSKRAFFTKQSSLPDVSSQPASSRASAGGRQPEAASTRTGGGSRLLPGLPRKIGWGKGCVIKPDGAAHIT